MDIDVVEFVRARLDEDEWWAREASRPRDGAPVPGGVHWHWVDQNDQALTIDPMLGDVLNDGGRAELRSVEQFPTRSVGSLPLFAVSYAEEVPTVVGGHIVRHDPARVLREVAAKRAILSEHGSMLERMSWDEDLLICNRCRYDQGLDTFNWPCPTVRALASIWSDHPDYDQAWAVE